MGVATRSLVSGVVAVSWLLAVPGIPSGEEMEMNLSIFDITELSRERAESGRSYLEFLRVDALNAGLYHLAAGSEDRQSPHKEDEVYHIVKGKARFRAGEEERPVQAGSVIYVRAGVGHRFLEIEEDLEVLVFFSSRKHSE
jgi:mannose-6-phosphate isomerase-like protein (cupin superfamily)